MSPWDQFHHQQKQRLAHRKRLVTVLLSTVGVTAAAALFFILRPDSSAEQPDLTALVAQEQASAPEGKANDHAAASSGVDRSPRSPNSAGSAPFSLSSNAADDDAAARLSRLEENLLEREVAMFQKSAVRPRGPRQISYTVSGSGQSHAFTPGQATFGDTDIVGAAGEWVVRPWWKPGWVPNSADCGEVGTAAVAGHVSWAGRPGPFHDLGAMSTGDEITCQASSGRFYTYTVTEVVRIDYSNTDYYHQSSSESGRELTLFSCTPEISGIVVVRAKIGG